MIFVSRGIVSENFSWVFLFLEEFNSSLVEAEQGGFAFGVWGGFILGFFGWGESSWVMMMLWLVR